LLVSVYLLLLFFHTGTGSWTRLWCRVGCGQLAVVPALVAAAPAAAAAEAKGASQDPWSKFCASGEITSVAAVKDVAGSVSHQLKHATQQLKHVSRLGLLSHPVLEGKPNANHVRARIKNSRTQRLHNWTSSHNARNK
jgi:hypothetical protein